jgi:hypothetical protein
MVKFSLDNIILSKMCPIFKGGTDRTCKGLSKYLDKKTMEVPFDNNIFNLRKNIGQISINKIGTGYDNEIN